MAQVPIPRPLALAAAVTVLVASTLLGKAFVSDPTPSDRATSAAQAPTQAPATAQPTDGDRAPPEQESDAPLRRNDAETWEGRVIAGAAVAGSVTSDPVTIEVRYPADLTVTLAESGGVALAPLLIKVRSGGADVLTGHSPLVGPLEPGTYEVWVTAGADNAAVVRPYRAEAGWQEMEPGTDPVTAATSKADAR